MSDARARQEAEKERGEKQKGMDRLVGNARIKVLGWRGGWGEGGKEGGPQEREASQEARWPHADRRHGRFRQLLERTMCGVPTPLSTSHVRPPLPQRLCLLPTPPTPTTLQLGEDRPFLEILPDVIKGYGMSLQHGSEHSSQSLPRMLTLWFEFGTYLHTFRKGQASVACLVLLLHGGLVALLVFVIHHGPLRCPAPETVAVCGRQSQQLCVMCGAAEAVCMLKQSGTPSPCPHCLACLASLPADSPYLSTFHPCLARSSPAPRSSRRWQLPPRPSPPS